MKSLSLYDMTTEVLELLETGEEISQEQLDAAFGAITEKDNRIAFFIRDLESSAEAHKAEEKRLSDRRRAMENKTKRLKVLIQENMERLGMDKVTTGTFTLSIQANPPALEEIDKGLCPCEYMVVIPQHEEIDTTAVKEALKAGKDVPGYRLTRGRSLRIR